MHVASSTHTPVLRLSTGDKKPLVPISMQFGTNYFENLNLQDLTLDSAREVGFNRAFSEMLSVLKSDIMVLHEGPALSLERASQSLDTLQSLHQWGHLDLPGDLAELSLEQETHVIARTLSRYMGSVVETRHPTERPIILATMALPFVSLAERGRNHREYMLPERDLDRPAIERSGPVFTYELYSHEQLCRRISKFYDLCQQEYRELAEKIFPTLKSELSFYRIGPVAYRAFIPVDRNGKITGFIKVSWTPVATMNSALSTCQVVPAGELAGRDDSHHEYDRIKRELSAIGRSATDFSYGSRVDVSHYLGSSSLLRNEVYKKLLSDLERIQQKR